MLAVAAAAIALLPGVLTGTVADLKPRTPLPILLPDSLDADFDRLYPASAGRRNSYSIELGAAPDCHGATVCFAAEFRARRGGTPSGPRKATLARGRHGRYQPSRCGASCSPPGISWRERGVTYTIRAKVAGRAQLVRMANQAIRRGPR